MYADLHLHSVYSDGTDTPDELIQLAENNDINVISITDHDSISAYSNINHNRESNTMIIPGIEISTVLGHAYLHILGYYIDISSKDLMKYIDYVSGEKTDNTRVIFENALSHGYFTYEWDRIAEQNKNQPRISGVHVVAAMQKDKITINGMSIWDMFHKFFWAESPDFISTETTTAYDAIDIIKKTGGISIIAHPKSIRDDDMILELIKYGVQGLEVYHPIHTAHDNLKYQQIAERHNLFISGGTDWHGGNNGANITRFGICGLDSNEYPILTIRETPNDSLS